MKQSKELDDGIRNNLIKFKEKNKINDLYHLSCWLYSVFINTNKNNKHLENKIKTLKKENQELQLELNRRDKNHE